MQRETVKEISHRTNGNARAVDKIVAQVSQPAVSQCFQPADVANSNPTSDLGHAADWKSAIQQVVKPALRYRRAPSRRAGRLCQPPCHAGAEAESWARHGSHLPP